MEKLCFTIYFPKLKWYNNKIEKTYVPWALYLVETNRLLYREEKLHEVSVLQLQ